MFYFYAVPQRTARNAHLWPETVRGCVVAATSEREAARIACERFSWRSTRVRPAASTPVGYVAAWRVYNAGGTRLASTGGYNAPLASTVLR